MDLVKASINVWVLECGKIWYLDQQCDMRHTLLHDFVDLSNAHILLLFDWLANWTFVMDMHTIRLQAMLQYLSNISAAQNCTFWTILPHNTALFNFFHRTTPHFLHFFTAQHRTFYDILPHTLRTFCLFSPHHTALFIVLKKCGTALFAIFYRT